MHDFDLLIEMTKKTYHDFHAGKPVEEIKKDLLASNLPDWMAEHIIKAVENY